MIKPYFIFKNKSSENFDIVVNKLPPQQTIDDEVEYIEIPGRDGYLTITKDRKTFLEKEIEISIYDDTNIHYIKQWLKGSGDLILANEPDVFYKSRIQTIRDFEEVSKHGPVSLVFRCQPYGYLHSGQNKIIVDVEDTILYNSGEETKPYFKVSGNGLVDLFINNDKIILDIDEYVEIDSELMESWKDTVNKPFIGKFPTFANGENIISWTGDISKIEVIPRWRR